MKFCAKVVKFERNAKTQRVNIKKRHNFSYHWTIFVMTQKKRGALKSPLSPVIRLGLEPKTPSLKGMCSTC